MCLVSAPGEFWASRKDFSKAEKNRGPTRRVFVDEFQRNTSQANYFEGFWRIKSETDTKIEVRKKQYEPLHADRRFAYFDEL